MSLPAPPGPPQHDAGASAPAWGELERLLARWRAGDPVALDLLLSRIHPTLYRWALANATDVDDADDIAQQALVAVYRKIGQFRSEAPLAVWLYRLTTRCCAWSSYHSLFWLSFFRAWRSPHSSLRSCGREE